MTANASVILSRRKRSYVLEMIDFQNDKEFGYAIEAVVTEIYEKINSGTREKDLEKSEIIERLSDLIRRRLKFEVVFELESPMVAAVLPFYPNRNHVLLKDFVRGMVLTDDQIKTLTRASRDFGTVDTKKVTVSGSFSKGESTMYLSFTDFIRREKLTVPETTAVILHELGHIFDSFEYADRMETSNFIIADVMKYAIGKKEKAEKKYIYQELEKAGVEIDPAEVELLLSDDKVIAGKHWFNMYIGHISSQMNERTYDQTMNEALADVFVARFGYGVPLVTGLNKVHKLAFFGYPSTTNLVMINIFRTLQAGIIMLSLMFDLKLIAAGKILGYFGIFRTVGLALGMVATSKADTRDMTYDELKIRYKRVRNQFIENLKDPNLDEKFIKEAIEGIKVLDMTMSEMSNIPLINRVIADAVFPAARRAKNSIQDQRHIEDLMSSDLFLKAAQLKVQP